MKLKTDLLVAGGGIAGMCAAISAARHGLSVILINDRSVLGGNASSEIGVGISGACHDGMNASIYAKETGIVEEIRLRLNYYKQFEGYGHHALLDAVFFDMIYNEKNINLILNTVVCGCETKDNMITKVFAKHSVNSENYEIEALAYIDATGNGALGFEAGAEFKIGREGKDEYNEYWAPEKADDFTMGNSIYFETEDAGKPVSFKAPDFAHDISKMEFLKDINKPENFRGLSCFGPHWAYEYGGQVDILKDHDCTELELRKLIYGIWDYVKNSGKYPQANNRYLKRVFAKAGTRESRRFTGDYVLCENDIEEKRDYPDSVAIGGWPMDIHAPKGIYDSLPASNFVPVTGNYNIPFRCLYSKNIKNLMLAGRDLSATHIALGSTRVMATCGALGQAVGTAAYLVKKYNAYPKEIYENHIDELRKMLVDDDQSILHLCDKKEDIKIEASSVLEYENVDFCEYIPLERDYALALSVDTDEIKSVKLRLKAKESTNLKIKLFTGTHPETYLPENFVKSIEIPLNANTSGWVEIPLDASRGEDGKIFIVLCENENIFVATGKKRPVGAVTYRMHTEENHEKKNHDSIPVNEEKTGYTHIDHVYERERNILFKDISPKQTVYAPKNIVNGYTRPYKTPNLWIADGKENESITLYPKRNIKGISLVFNSDLDIDNYRGMSKSMVKNFTVEFYGKNGVFKKEISENYKRLVKIEEEIENVEKIVVNVKETYGNNVSIYAINVF